jgi:hypothetical protein
MNVSLDLFVIKVRVSTQPFRESYQRYKGWVMQTWMKLVWEEDDMFAISIQIALLQTQPPHSGDKFMQAEIEAGYTREEELHILTWYCCHRQVLDSGGRALDEKYMTR